MHQMGGTVINAAERTPLSLRLQWSTPTFGNCRDIQSTQTGAGLAVTGLVTAEKVAVSGCCGAKNYSGNSKGVPAQIIYRELDT